MKRKPSFGPEQFAAGDVIIRQGDRPEKFYIITRGRVEVVEQLANGRHQRLEVLQAGDYFGEIGMLTQQSRVATVRALTPVFVMSMDRATFADWLRSSPIIQEEIESTIKKRRPQTDKLRRLQEDETKRPFGHQKPQTGFFETAHLKHVKMFAPGEFIMRQGETADVFYMIVSGKVEVTRREPDGQERVLDQLGAGDYFGEIGLLEGNPRIATVRAVSSVKVVAFDRDSFLSWMNKSPDSQEDISETAARRKQTGLLTPPDPSEET